MDKKRNLKDIIKDSLLCVQAVYESNLALTDKGINTLTDIVETEIRTLMKIKEKK